jgi:hypothetical protein
MKHNSPYPNFFAKLVGMGAEISDSWLVGEKTVIFEVERWMKGSKILVERGHELWTWELGFDVEKLARKWKRHATTPPDCEGGLHPVTTAARKLLIQQAINQIQPHRVVYNKLNGSRVWMGYAHLWQAREAADSLHARCPKGHDLDLGFYEWTPRTLMERSLVWGPYKSYTFNGPRPKL